jgi:hypothetical protein
MTKTATRRQRRAQLKAMGYLKIKNKFGRFSEKGLAWYDNTQKNGKQMHANNVQKNLDAIENDLQSKANDLKETWSAIGYNDNEIAMLEEAFFILNVKDKESLREDKKTARELMKNAASSLKSRLNAIS